ncbi:MAG: Uma2 family endonuclease [Saprospiraceae bacterium]
MFETAGTQEKLMTFEEYIDFEEKSEVKHEFDNGKLIEMSGASLFHNRIFTSLMALLPHFLNQKKGNDFEVFGSDMKIFFPELDKAVYPDIVIIKGEPELSDTKTHSLSNPHLVVEILSKSTEKYDRTIKFDNYRTLSSLREYVLISQDEPLVEAFYLHDPENDLWKITRAHGLDASILLRSIECTLALKDVYHRVKFEQA